ncbi:unnamed protein product, partial [Dicrocoelium dendriticum]
SAYYDLAIFFFDGPDCMSRWIGYVWYPENNPLISPGNSITALLTVQQGMQAYNPWLRVLDGSTCGGTMLSELSPISSIPQNGILSNSNTMTVVYTEAFVGMGLTNIDASFSEIITEDTTTNGTGTAPISTAPVSSMKPTDGATKAVTKCPITFLVVIFICELLDPFN